MNSERYDHKLYKHVTDIKDADAIAYAWVNKEKAVNFPYKQPDLEDHEIRANVLYAGLCHSDCLSVRSLWGDALYPIAPGHEIIGEVSEVGKNVTDFKKGDKVAFGTLRAICEKCKYCTINKESLCTDVKEEKFTYGFHWGGYSTQLQQPANFFFKVPDTLDLPKAAPLLCAGVTVYNPIKQYLKKGMKTAVIGVGGLGHLAVQFLHKMGHHVTGVSNTLDKADLIKSLGANEVIATSNVEEFSKHKGEYDFIINTLPVSHNFQDYLGLTAPFGYFVQVGLPDVSEKVSFSINPIVINEIHIVGSCVASRADTNEMLELCAKESIYPLVEEFPFEEFDKAFEKLEKGKPKFRCVVNCGDYSKKIGLFK
jgi:D-arabinose 1-dehydrogenase-like Zn-dependent alcohol dehydrogenase